MRWASASGSPTAIASVKLSCRLNPGVARLDTLLAMVSRRRSEALKIAVADSTSPDMIPPVNPACDNETGETELTSAGITQGRPKGPPILPKSTEKRGKCRQKKLWIVWAHDDGRLPRRETPVPE